MSDLLQRIISSTVEGCSHFIELCKFIIGYFNTVIFIIGMIFSSLLKEHTLQSNNTDKSIPLHVAEILQKTCEMIPIGKSPIEELSLEWKNKADYN